jgi:hypothetical protein
MRGIFLEADLLNSTAFRSLSRWAFFVYLRFLQKRVLEKIKHKSKSDSFRIVNNGEIIFLYREAKKCGIDERAFRNALDELIEKGFLDIARQGKGGRSGESTLYFLGTRWRDYGTDRFRPTQNPRVKDTIQGRGWAAFNAKKKLKPADKNDSAITGKTSRRSGETAKKRLAKTTVVKNGEISATL